LPVPERTTAGQPVSAGPPIIPRPAQLTGGGDPLDVSGTVRILAGTEVDEPTRDLLSSALRSAGAREVVIAGLAEPASGGLTVVAGLLGNRTVADRLRAAAGAVPARLPAEGYA